MYEIQVVQDLDTGDNLGKMKNRFEKWWLEKASFSDGVLCRMLLAQSLESYINGSLGSEP
jgi:hypothetical protein